MGRGAITQRVEMWLLQHDQKFGIKRAIHKKTEKH